MAAHATCVPARAGIQTTLGASAPPNGKKGGAGAEDAHKLVVRHNIDFCATCCSCT